MLNSAPHLHPLQITVFRGKEAILSTRVALERLAARCGQPGAMGWMEYFLSLPEFAWKTPYLVLFGSCRMDPTSLRAEDVSAEDLRAAVLLFEYRILGMGTGVFATVDSSAFRSVVAPAAERAGIAAMASQALLRQGAQVVIVSYDDAARQPRGA